MKKLAFLGFLLLMIFFGAKAFWGAQLAPVSSEEVTKLIVISKGHSVSDIAKQLEKEGLIRSAWAFNLYVKQKGVGANLQAGRFELSPSMSVEEIVKTLQSNPAEIWVTLIEGWRVEEMAEELNSKFGIRNSDFLAVAKEGHMFPDTYLFSKEASAEQVVGAMRDNFERRFSKELRDQIKLQGLTEEQGVILASIVEREARSDKVRTEVASILLKRLKIGMGLNADATVQYAKDSADYKAGRLDKFWKPIAQKDYQEVKSLFNTYIYQGLPPAPICNPSLSSLKAVANADPSTSYLYYYHDSKGNSYYAKTLEEHNRNVANNP